MCYAKQADTWSPNLLQRSETANDRYKNPDNDPRGPWTSGDLTARNYYGAGTYPITCPGGRVIEGPPTGTYWRVSHETFQELVKDNRIYWGPDGNNTPRLKRFLSEVKQGIVPQTLWTYEEVGHTQEAKKELLAAVDFATSQDVFDTPKPTRLIRRMLQIATTRDGHDIVMDFFCGSATTAHAVMAQNAEDGGNRRFIMVQLPQPIKSEGFSTLCDIGKERIRRAGEKIIEEQAHLHNAVKTGALQGGKAYTEFTTSTQAQETQQKIRSALDIGFRVLKLDDTNMEDVYYSAQEYDQQMLQKMESNIKPDRTDLDLLFGCLLEWGLPLSMPYRSEQVEGCTVHTYNDGDLIACFDENIPESVIREIAKRKPLRAVFRDSGFATSPEKINVGEIFKLLAPDTRVKVI